MLGPAGDDVGLVASWTMSLHHTDSPAPIVTCGPNFSPRGGGGRRSFQVNALTGE